MNHSRLPRAVKIAMGLIDPASDDGGGASGGRNGGGGKAAGRPGCTLGCWRWWGRRGLGVAVSAEVAAEGCMGRWRSRSRRRARGANKSKKSGKKPRRPPIQLRAAVAM